MKQTQELRGNLKSSQQEKKIILLEELNEVEKFIGLKQGPEKNYVWYNNHQNRVFYNIDLLLRDGAMYFAICEFTIKKGKYVYYKKINQKNGFTLKDGKIKIWFNKSIESLFSNISFQRELTCPLLMLFQKLDIDWFPDELISFITQSGLAAILTKKINNPIDFLKHYLKVSRMACSPRKLYQAILKGNLRKIEFYRFSSISKNVDHFLDYYLNCERFPEFHHLNDMIAQANILEKKINFRWSQRRMHEVHTMWSKELLKIARFNLKDEQIPGLYSIPETPPEISLLDTKLKVFEEGLNMNHCLYTNYMKRMLDKKYVAFHVSYKGEEATLGMVRKENVFVFDQLYCAYNRRASEQMLSFCEVWIKQNKILYSESNHFSKKKELDFPDLKSLNT